MASKPTPPQVPYSKPDYGCCVLGHYGVQAFELDFGTRPEQPDWADWCSKAYGELEDE